MFKEFNQREEAICSSKVVENDLRLKEDEEDRIRERKHINDKMLEYYESIKGSITFRGEGPSLKKKGNGT